MRHDTGDLAQAFISKVTGDGHSTGNPFLLYSSLYLAAYASCDQPQGNLPSFYNILFITPARDVQEHAGPHLVRVSAPVLNHTSIVCKIAEVVARIAGRPDVLTHKARFPSPPDIFRIKACV